MAYQIDGMVIKVNRYDQRDILGATGRSPRWCIAYKYPAERAQTVVESIAVQVGKTGALTPVANLKAVPLAGTTVRRASLHNFDEMRRLDVRPGDTVMIEKAGEIIPQVVEVKREFRPAGAEPFPVPKKCPNCGTEVVKDEAGVYGPQTRESRATSDAQSRLLRHVEGEAAVLRRPGPDGHRASGRGVDRAVDRQRAW